MSLQKQRDEHADLLSAIQHENELAIAALEENRKKAESTKAQYLVTKGRLDLLDELIAEANHEDPEPHTAQSDDSQATS